ncbi:MAG: response regulator [Bryobacteraceae bacterium]
MLHILLAEDNRGDILLVQQALEEHHIPHELHVVTDGEEALHFVTRMGKPGEAPCPDVLLLDLNLPKADGYQVLSEFRQHPECAHTPVIVVTSSDAPKDRAGMAALGIARYFRKPSELDAFMQLGAVVREVVEGQVA